MAEENERHAILEDTFRLVYMGVPNNLDKDIVFRKFGDYVNNFNTYRNCYNNNITISLHSTCILYRFHSMPPNFDNLSVAVTLKKF